jgi:hypothetical protein
MSDGANKKFISGREKFLRENMIIIKNPQQYLALQKVDLKRPPGPLVLDFDLVHDPNTKYADTHGANVKVYTLALMEIRKGYLLADDDEGVLTATRIDAGVGKNTHAIRAYYLPWDNNRHYESQLGNAADFMFTPTLDGCSFVIGSGPNPRVSHLNYQDAATGRIDKAKIKTKITKVFGADPVAPTVLKLKNYSPNSHAEKLAGKTTMLTVVGFRNPTTNSWSFCYQRRTNEMGAMGVQQILTDRLVPI